MSNSATAMTPDLVRVLIATTEGPVEIEAIVDLDVGEAPIVALGQGAVAIEGLRAEYRNFVSPGLGVIAKNFGHDTFRLELSNDIQRGESWQLAVFIAHALHKQNRLAEKGVEASTLVWATGQVDYYLRVRPINNLADKISVSLDQLKLLSEGGTAVHAFWPEANRSEVADTTRVELSASGVQIYEAERVHEVLAAIGLAPPAARPKPAGEIPPRSSRVGARRLALAASLLGVVFAAAALFTVAGFSGPWSRTDPGRVEAPTLYADPTYMLHSCDIAGVRLGMSMSQASAALKDKLGPAVDIRSDPGPPNLLQLLNDPLPNSASLDYQAGKASIHISFTPITILERGRPEVVDSIDYEIQNPTDADRASLRAATLAKYGSPSDSGSSKEWMTWSQCPGLVLQSNGLHLYDQTSFEKSMTRLQSMIPDCARGSIGRLHADIDLPCNLINKSQGP